MLELESLESTTPELVIDTKINHTSTHQITTLKSSTKIGFLWLLTLESTTPEPSNNFLQFVSTYQMTTQKSSTKIRILWLLTLESTTPEPSNNILQSVSIDQMVLFVR